MHAGNRRVMELVDKQDTLTFAGRWKISDEDADEMKVVIASLRKKSTEELMVQISYAEVSKCLYT